MARPAHREIQRRVGGTAGAVFVPAVASQLRSMYLGLGQDASSVGSSIGPFSEDAMSIRVLFGVYFGILCGLMVACVVHAGRLIVLARSQGFQQQMLPHWAAVAALLVSAGTRGHTLALRAFAPGNVRFGTRMLLLTISKSAQDLLYSINLYLWWWATCCVAPLDPRRRVQRLLIAFNVVQVTVYVAMGAAFLGFGANRVPFQLSHALRDLFIGAVCVTCVTNVLLIAGFLVSTIRFRAVLSLILQGRGSVLLLLWTPRPNGPPPVRKLVRLNRLAAVSMLGLGMSTGVLAVAAIRVLAATEYPKGHGIDPFPASLLPWIVYIVGELLPSVALLRVLHLQLQHRDRGRPTERNVSGASLHRPLLAPFGSSIVFGSAVTLTTVRSISGNSKPTTAFC